MGLSELQSDLTERLILDAALKVLERTGEITARAAAGEAGISERTVFRYFSSREAFLTAVGGAMVRAISAPPHPASIAELRAMPRALFTAFDERRELVRAAWHSELRQYIIGSEAKERWLAIRMVFDAAAPRAPERLRKLAAGTVRYHLSASTWHYYRFVFQFSLAETIEATEILVDQQLGGLGLKPRRRSAPGSGSRAGPARA